MELFRNHTSILEATTTIIQKNEIEVQKQFESMSVTLKEITQAYEKAELQMSEQKRQQVFQEIALQSLLMLIRYEQTQDTFIDLISDTQHGKVNPFILPPREILEQAKIIKNNIPKDLSIPGGNQQQNLMELYTSMTILTRTTESTLLFNVKIPLISNMNLQLFKIQPVPIRHLDEFIFIDPTTSYLLINLERNLYYPMEEIELLKYRDNNNGKYLCQQNHPLYKPESGICECEIKLLQHRKDIIPSCKLRKMKPTRIWRQLAKSNQWIYGFEKEDTIDIICNNVLHSTIMKGVGILQLNEHCAINQPHVIIQSSTTHTTELKASYLPSINLTELLNTKNESNQLKNWIPPIYQSDQTIDEDH